MTLFKALLLAGIIGLAAPAAAQLRPSPLKDIYAAYNDCFKVASVEGIKPAELKPLGWSRATISKGGKEVPSDLAIFGHANRVPIIMLSAESGDGLCIVMARLESKGAFEQFKSAWGSKLPAPDAKGDIIFSAEGHIVLLRQTGSDKQPSMTISVMTPTEKK